LEALPHVDLPKFGPGHGEGGFLITEFQVEQASKTNASAWQRLKIVNGATDQIADGLDLSETWNGRGEQGRREGWGIDRDSGRPHWATFVLDKAVGEPEGSHFRISIQHRFEPGHEIGRFRIWVTRGEHPEWEGLPADIVSIVKTSPFKRTEAQKARLNAHYRELDPSLLRLGFERELAQRPLPPDERMKELEQDLVRASRPVVVDPILNQLRLDVRLSRRQLDDRRLVAAQDLTWALINTPSFLFNR
jgi:hypothetical protein